MNLDCNRAPDVTVDQQHLLQLLGLRSPPHQPRAAHWERLELDGRLLGGEWDAIETEGCCPNPLRRAGKEPINHFDNLAWNNPRHPAGPLPHFARSSHARIAASASGSAGSGSAACSALRSLVRLRPIEVAIAGFAAAGAGLAGASSLAGGGVAGSGSSGGGTAALALLRFRTIAGPASATAFRFFDGGLGR